jgi:hypothetical protein
LETVELQKTLKAKALRLQKLKAKALRLQKLKAKALNSRKRSKLKR